MFLLEVLYQLPVRGCDLLSRNQAVHHVVEARCRQHQLDVIERSAAVDVANPLVEQLVANAHVGNQSGQLSLTQPNPAAEVVDGALGLGDERVLSGDPLVETDDKNIDRVQLRQGAVDRPLDGLKLPLVVHLLPDARVVGKTRLVDGRRIAWIAVDGRGRAQRLRQPNKGRKNNSGGKSKLQIRSSHPSAPSMAPPTRRSRARLDTKAGSYESGMKTRSA